MQLSRSQGYLQQCRRRRQKWRAKMLLNLGERRMFGFLGGEDFLCVLCCAALAVVGITRLTGTTAGLLRTPVWTRTLAFMIHRLNCWQSIQQGKWKGQNYPVFCSAVLLCFRLIEKLPSNSKRKLTSQCKAWFSLAVDSVSLSCIWHSSCWSVGWDARMLCFQNCRLKEFVIQ